MSRPPMDIPRDGPRRGYEAAAPTPEREAALSAMPATGWLLTSCYDGERVGLPVRWVQRAGHEPPLVSVIVTKGNPIATLIRDSRAFALNLLPEAQPLLTRRFTNGMMERLGDPFETLALERMATMSPCLREARVVIDCELFRQIDLDTECAMYVGMVLATRVQ